MEKGLASRANEIFSREPWNDDFEIARLREMHGLEISRRIDQILKEPSRKARVSAVPGFASIRREISKPCIS